MIIITMYLYNPKKNWNKWLRVKNQGPLAFTNHHPMAMAMHNHLFGRQQNIKH